MKEKNFVIDIILYTCAIAQIIFIGIYWVSLRAEIMKKKRSILFLKHVT